MAELKILAAAEEEYCAAARWYADRRLTAAADLPKPLRRCFSESSIDRSGARRAMRCIGRQS